MGQFVTPPEGETKEVATLRSAAILAREIDTDDTELHRAIADLLDTAANRLEAHPKATGGMTQASLRLARIYLFR